MLWRNIENCYSNERYNFILIRSIFPTYNRKTQYCWRLHLHRNSVVHVVHVSKLCVLHKTAWASKIKLYIILDTHLFILVVTLLNWSEAVGFGVVERKHWLWTRVVSIFEYALIVCGRTAPWGTICLKLNKRIKAFKAYIKRYIFNVHLI